MLRIGLIGCGGHAYGAHGSPLAHYVSLHPGEIGLVAACDVAEDRAARFCREFGFARSYTDLEAMLAAEAPDAVVCALPAERTAVVGIHLLELGIPCMIEKPLGAALPESVALVEAARRTGTRHAVSMNRRYSPYLNRAITWAGERGPLRYVHGKMLRHNRREDSFLWGTGIHVVDAMRHIGGEVAEFSVQHMAGDGEAMVWQLVSLRYASGARGHVEILPTVGMVTEEFELFGEDYRASVTTTGLEGESVRGWREGKLEFEERADLSAPLFLRDGSYEETCAFLHGLMRGAPLYPTLAQVLPSSEICAGPETA